MLVSGKTVKPAPEVRDGVAYSFMNCDTGRKIYVDGKTEFTVTALGEGQYALRLGGAYVSLPEGARTGAPAPVRIVPLKNSRYMVLLEDGAALCDDDSGESREAALAPAKNLDAIECCWYLTEQGKPEPMKIMPIGDSITFGANVDVPEDEWVGCRPELAEMFAEDPDNRFVFVGSMKEHNSGMDDTVLYRHEGHGGWMAEDIYQVNPESRGLIDYLDQFLGKYTPDVVLTQVGTNDCAFAAGPSMYEEVPYTEQSMAALKARWNGYMDKLWALLPPDGAIIVATVPPTTRTQCFDDWINEFNKEIPAAVARYQAAGRKSELAPTNQMISDSTPERGLCSDKVHLSAQGYTAMAKAYYQAFKKVYPNTIGR